MKSILSKVSIALASLAVMPLTFAASDLHSRVEQLEKQMSQVGTENAFGGYGAKTACARPSKDNKNWFITGDVLYWSSTVGGTDFAFSDDSPTFTYPIKGRTKDVDFDWSFGFRVGLGYNFCRDCWDIYAEYTNFSNDGSRSVSGGGCGSSVILPLRGAVCPPDQAGAAAWQANNAKSSFDLDFQSVDLNIGRNYFISQFLSMRPFFGVKIGFIDLEQRTTYSCNSNTSQLCGITFVGLDGNFIKITEDSDFSGAGLEMGLNTKWHLAKGFSFFANAMGALTYGYFDVDYKERYGETDRRATLSGSTHRVVPTAQLHAGVAYDIFFDCDSQHIGFSLGYDTQYWWRVNQMLQMQQAGPSRYNRYSEDVGMYGVTFEARWDF